MPDSLERIYNRPIFADIALGEIVLGVIAVVVILAIWNTIARARMLK